MDGNIDRGKFSPAYPTCSARRRGREREGVSRVGRGGARWSKVERGGESCAGRKWRVVRSGARLAECAETELEEMMARPKKCACECGQCRRPNCAPRRATPDPAPAGRLAGWPAVTNHAERTPPARARGRRAHGTLRQLKKSHPSRLVVVQGTFRQRRSTHLDKAGTVVAHHAVHVAETHGATARRRYGDHRGEGLDKLAAEPRARRLSLDAELGSRSSSSAPGWMPYSDREAGRGVDPGGTSSCQERCEELLNANKSQGASQRRSRAPLCNCEVQGVGSRHSRVVVCHTESFDKRCSRRSVWSPKELLPSRIRRHFRISRSTVSKSPWPCA